MIPSENLGFRLTHKSNFPIFLPRKRDVLAF
jgi:hypothetical protein